MPMTYIARSFISNELKDEFTQVGLSVVEPTLNGTYTEPDSDDYARFTDFTGTPWVVSGPGKLTSNKDFTWPGPVGEDYDTSNRQVAYVIFFNASNQLLWYVPVATTKLVQDGDGGVTAPSGTITLDY